MNSSASSVPAKAGAAVFGLLALISSVQIYAFRKQLDEPITVFSALAYGIGSWIVWALSVPLITRLGRRFDGRRGRRAISLVVHLFAMLLVLLPATMAVVITGTWLFSPGEAINWSEVPQLVLTSSRFQFGFLLYATILGATRAVDRWDELRQRELAASQLEAQATRARLESLAARLQPHFMFNALHTVGALVDEDPAKARKVLTGIGDLLREMLAEPTATEVPLEGELVLLEKYLEIERIRFADRLRVVVEVDSATRSTLVPRLLLQPIVENALRHGVSPLARGGTVKICAALSDGVLRISVANDGVPLATPMVEGVGMRTTRERLATRYGEEATLTMHEQDGWVESLIVLPVKEQEG